MLLELKGISTRKPYLGVKRIYIYNMVSTIIFMSAHGRVHEKEKELEWLAVSVKSHAVTDVPKKTMNVVNPMP